MSMPGGMEWIIIVVAVLILFGGKKIPEFMRGIGKGMKDFKNAKDNVQQEFTNAVSGKDVEPVK